MGWACLVFTDAGSWVLGVREIASDQLAQLCHEIAAGQAKAIETVYRHYQASLFAFIRLRVRDDGAAEEILSDTFLTAFGKINQYNGSSAFLTWLCGIAKNVVGTWLRKQQRGVLKATIPVDDTVLLNFADPDAGVLECLVTAEATDALHECIDQLPQTQREAFFWTWFEEEPLESVASKLSCPVGTVKSRLFNARAKIADCVKNTFGPEAGHA